MRRAHAYIGVRESPAGHVGLCRCGHETEPQWDRQSAQAAIVEHITAMAPAVTP